MLTNAPHTHTQNQKQKNSINCLPLPSLHSHSKTEKFDICHKEGKKKTKKNYEKLNIVEKNNTPTQNKLSQTNKQEKKSCKRTHLNVRKENANKKKTKTSEKSFISLSYPVVDK